MTSNNTGMTLIQYWVLNENLIGNAHTDSRDKNDIYKFNAIFKNKKFELIVLFCSESKIFDWIWASVTRETSFTLIKKIYF